MWDEATTARGWRRAFVVSVLVNVLLMGGAVGYGVSARNAAAERLLTEDTQRARALVRPGDVWNRELNPRALLAALPPELRRQAARGFLEQGRGARHVVREGRRAREAALAEIFAEDFDAEAVGAALQQAREAEARMVARGHDVLLSVLSSLPEEERRAALQRVRDGLTYDGRAFSPQRDRRPRHGGRGPDPQRRPVEGGDASRAPVEADR